MKANYFTSFQYDAFKRQARKAKTDMNNSTITPRLSHCMGSTLPLRLLMEMPES